MLKNAKDDNFGDKCDRQVFPRPQLVRHVSNRDEEDEKPVTSSQLLGELQRINASYNTDAKSQLDPLDGSGGANRIEIANIVREILMESQGEQIISSNVKPKTFDEAWNCPGPTQQEFWRSAIRKD